MKPIRAGDRGPAVEDIQKRLLFLGYALGPTGVDGVFLDHTVEAVKAFKSASGLDDAAVVDERTWSALVDASFSLGDRVLYLRVPHFHGNDVTQLQSALTVLGFSCGQIDGIFGPSCESAVREFQFNVGIPADGIVGVATNEAIGRLRHVWEGKDAVARSRSDFGFARAQEVLDRLALALAAADGPNSDIADRVVNLALATSPAATVEKTDGRTPPDGIRVIIELAENTPGEGRPTVAYGEFETLPARIATAVASSPTTPARIAIGVPGAGDLDDRGRQQVAVRLLDAVCVALA